MRLYQFNTKTAKHFFCSKCGIHTHHQRRSNPAEYSYNVGCLEGVNPFELGPVPTYDGVNHPADRHVSSTEAIVDTPVPSQRPRPIELRKAVPADALCLSVLAMQVYLDTYAREGIRPAIARDVLSSYTEQVFSEAIADSQTRFCVAGVGDHLVGFAQVTLGARHQLAPGDSHAELLRLYVQEPLTGQGLGTRLLAEAEQLARKAEASVLWLTPWVHNHRALAFYSKRGYQDFGLTHFVIEAEAHENRVYAKNIAAPAAV